MNPIMVDGTGMCGGCRLTVGGETKFACVDGPEFDGHLVDFDEAMERSGVYKNLKEKQAVIFLTRRFNKNANRCNEKKSNAESGASVRNKNFKEVALGYDAETVRLRKQSAVWIVKHKPCMNGCPVNISIPEFISYVAEGEFEKAYEVISRTSTLPAVCGRVCPQEKQCEAKMCKRY